MSETAGPDPAGPLVMRARSGAVRALDIFRWDSAATPAEAALLEGCQAPVLDVGCGPGRLVEHLLAGGVEALGIDASDAAVAAAHLRSAPVLRRSVWSALPGEGRWATVLLFDGNIGIGGEPARLLARCAGLLRPGGQVLVEVETPGRADGPTEVRLERGERVTEWFPWATVAADGLDVLAGPSGLDLLWVRAVEDDGASRWFGLLRRLAVAGGATLPAHARYRCQ